MATRPVPQPASRMRAGAGSRVAQNVASPCTSAPEAASAANRAAYPSPLPSPATSDQRVRGVSLTPPTLGGRLRRGAGLARLPDPALVQRVLVGAGVVGPEPAQPRGGQGDAGDAQD